MCGGSNPVQDLVSSVSDTLASIDPGPSIGSAFAELDKGVNSAIPGGWITLAALAATVLSAGAAAGWLAEDLAIEGTIAMEDGSMLTTFSDGSTALTDVGGNTVYTSAGGTPMGTIDTTVTSMPSADPSAGATITDVPSSAVTQAPAPVTQTPGADAILNGSSMPSTSSSGLQSLSDPSLTTQIGGSTAPSSSGTFGSISAPLSGSGAVPGAGAVTNAGGLTGALPGGVLVGDGTGGTIMGATYIDAGGGVPAMDMFGNPVQASSVGIGGIDTSSGLSLSDLNNARRAYNLAKGLTSSGSSGFSLTPYTTLGSDSSGSGGTIQNVINRTAPKATMIQGQQIQSQMPTGLENPVQTAATAPQTTSNPLADLQLIQNAATGGYMQHMALGGLPMPMSELRMKGRQTGFGVSPHGANLIANILGHREGGEIEGHNPTFFSVGGLNSLENTYVQGEGDGTSDDVAAMLADGEFVIPADVVSKIGNGSSNAGAKVLDQFLETVREHAQNHDPKDLPPTSKGPLAYLQEAKRKVNA